MQHPLRPVTALIGVLFSHIMYEPNSPNEQENFQTISNYGVTYNGLRTSPLGSCCDHKTFLGKDGYKDWFVS